MLDPVCMAGQFAAKLEPTDQVQGDARWKWGQIQGALTPIRLHFKRCIQLSSPPGVVKIGRLGGGEVDLAPQRLGTATVKLLKLVDANSGKFTIL